MTLGASDIGRRVADGLSRGKPFRLDLQGGGRVFVDHAVPVLAVHRRSALAADLLVPGVQEAREAIHRLATTQPAYVVASERDPDGTAALVSSVATALADACGRVLVVELWAPLRSDHAPDDPDPFDRQPGFTLYTSSDEADRPAADALCDALSGIEIAGQGADVDLVATPHVAPPGLLPLSIGDDRITPIGLAVDAVFHNAREGEFYPLVLDELREGIASPLADAAAVAASVEPVSVGRRHLEPAAEAVDAGLSDVSDRYGFLLQITPVNSAQAWDEFQAARCDQAPEFLYRPLTFDPDLLRRDLFALPVDAIEDPVVARLLRERRDEVEAQVRMVLDVGTRQFLPSSLRLFGAPDPPLVALARDILTALDKRPAPTAGAEVIGATAFAAAARAEVDHYRALSDAVPTEVEIRDDIPGSLMVSRGRLLIGARAQVSAARVPALLAHEIGTHVVTYANGAAQPLRQLRHGLAGYQDLQEGLAVLSEWLVGGLTARRLRTLAARVLGADALVDGADFVETFRRLRDDAGLRPRAAFTVALRLYRGGGLTKDIVYLRGLRDLLAHLAAGGAYWPLFAGKMALAHLPAVDALRQRGILADPPLRPRYADDCDALQRLDRARQGLTILDFVTDAA